MRELRNRGGRGDGGVRVRDRVRGSGPEGCSEGRLGDGGGQRQGKH